MMRVLLAVLVSALLSVSASRAENETYESLWSEATGPGHAVTDYDGFTMVETGGVFYYFTKPENDAHPGVIRRALVERDGRFFVEMNGWSFGSDAEQPAFRRWMAEFEALNRQMIESLEQQ
jgi:hypothetical protein